MITIVAKSSVLGANSAFAMSPPCLRRLNTISLRHVALLVIWMGFTVAESFADAQRDLRHAVHGRTYTQAAVAAEHPTCSTIGKDILQAGGSAVDAAIAALLCTGVINNFSSGIGGGGFMLIRTPDGKAEVVDFRETAPKGARQDMFVADPQASVKGGLSVAVPGEIRGFYMAHQKYGKLPWAELFRAVVDVARQGFPVSKKLASMIHKIDAEDIESSPALKRTYFDKDGKPLLEGALITRPDLAETLARIAEKGPSAFYEGPLALAMVKEVQKRGGILTMKDMRTYEAKWQPALQGEYRGYKIWTANVPSCGPVLLKILNILENFRLCNASSATELHRYIEALKFGYASRTQLGDPAFVDMEKQVRKITDKAWARELSQEICDTQTFPPEHYTEDQLFGTAESHGTTHLSVLDSFGMAVSATSTVNLEFGSRIIDNTTGVLLNNEMDDFSSPGISNSFGIPPSPSNFIEPRKRPLSSSTPVVIERNGRVFMVVGAAGGSRIISATVQSIINALNYAMSPLTAVSRPRLHHQLQPDEIIAEYETDHELLVQLQSKGHKIRILPMGQYPSSVQMILQPEIGRIIAISDPRKGGIADGY